MTVIAVIQQKGGVGKSTITANLAAELVHAKRTVKLIDLDPQQSLTHWAQMGHGLLRERVSPVEIDTDQLEHQAFLTAVAQAQQDAEYVLLDSPPGLPTAGMLAALVADIAILPVTPSPLDLMAVQDAIQLIREAQARRGGGKPVIALVPSRVGRTALGRDLPESLGRFHELVLPAISQRVAVAEAVFEGLTVREYLRESDAVGEFQKLAKAVERMVNA